LQNGVSEEIAMETANDAGFDEAIAESLPVTENNAVESESYQGVDMGLEELLNSIAGDSKSKTETSTVSETDIQNATGEALAQVVEPDIQSGRIDDSADSSANAVEPEKITEPQEVAEPQIVAEESQAVDEPIEQSEEPPAVTTEEQALEKLLQEEAQASLEGTALSSMKHGKALEETVKESVSQEKESQPQPETSDLLAQLDADKKPEEPETSDLLAQLDADKQTAEPEASDLLAQLDADKKPEEPETSDLLAQLDADKEPAEPEASDLLAQLDADKESAEPETSDLLAQLDAGKELAEPEASDLLAQLDADKQTTEQAVQTEVKQTAETEQTTETAKTDLKIGRETENVVNDENEKLKEKEMSEEKDVISINSVEEKKEPVAEPSTDMSFNVENADPETTYITKGTKIKGDLETDGSIDIIGRVEGNVICQGKLVVGGEVVGGITAGEIYANNARIQGDVKSYGSVKVGVGSMIIGGIEGESAVIAGAVNGDIDVKGPVIVDSTAVIMGNIKSRSVQINNGAVIEGFCSQSYSDIDVKSFFA
jgi:cytoskeletal protein CcmA (bactofilin family)